jgi:hypothetical protein
VGVRDALVDFLDAVDVQHVAGRPFGELVGVGPKGDGSIKNLFLSSLMSLKKLLAVE